MSLSQVTTETFWTAFRALSKSEREDFFNKLLSEKEFHDNIVNLALSEQHHNEVMLTIDDDSKEHFQLLATQHSSEAYKEWTSSANDCYDEVFRDELP